MKAMNKKGSELSNLVDFFSILFIILTFIAFFMIFKFQDERYSVSITAENKQVIGEFILNNYLRLETTAPGVNGRITNAELIALCVQENNCEGRVDLAPLQKYITAISDELFWKISIMQDGKYFLLRQNEPVMRGGRRPDKTFKAEMPLPPIYSPNAKLIEVKLTIGYYDELLKKV